MIHDRNGNGSLGSGAGGLPGATVYLDANNNGELDNGEESTTTDDRGRYHFLVEPGQYVVRSLTPHPDYEFTSNFASYNVNARIGVTSGQRDFAYRYDGSSWTNPLMSADVDGRDGVTPRDALLVINELTAREISEPGSGALPGSNNTASDLQFLDVVQDTVVSPLDALSVINELSGGNSNVRAPSSGQGGLTAIAPVANQAEETNDRETAVDALDDFFANL